MRHGLGIALAGIVATACGPHVGDLPARTAHPTRPRPPPVRPSRVAWSGDGVVALTPELSPRVRIGAGSFVMGSSRAETLSAFERCGQEPLGEDDVCEQRALLSEGPPHVVYLSEFAIDRTEVTRAAYTQCVDGGGCAELPYASGAQRFDAPDLPVVLVTHADAERYCAWAGGRLPTEAEWERAARGAEGRTYPWGRIYNPFLANHGRISWSEIDDGDGYLELAPVGSFPDGDTPERISDLAGNVEEWVADIFGQYPDANVVNPRGPATGDERVLRGGSYAHPGFLLRSAARGHDPPSQRRAWRGFRCAWDLGRGAPLP